MEPLENTKICVICYNSYPKDHFLNLLCSHTFCKTCIFTDWQSKIASGFLELNSLKCPQEGCSQLISLEFLYKALPKDQYFQLEELCNINSEVLTQDEKAVRCPHCEIRFYIWKEADYFNCSKCKTCFCSICLANWEKHKGITCKEYAKNKDLTPEIQAFIKEMKEKGFKQCPVCFTFVEIIGGCNFVRCLSPQCMKKTCFCILCDEKISEKEHYSHYLTSPWEEPCVNQEKNKEKQINFMKEVENIVECPGCGIRDGNICKFENGLIDNRFCFCKSEKCKGIMYCLLCKVKVTDKNFNEHSKGDCENVGIFHFFKNILNSGKDYFLQKH